MKLAIAVLLLIFLAVGSVEPKEIYFVKSCDRANFEVRHNFENGFSAWLNPHELEDLRSRGISVEKVELFNILAGKPGASVRQYYPSDRTPWGIETVYNDPGILSTSGGFGVDVAVLDTGVYKEHFDLKSRIGQCVDFTSPRGIKVGSCKDSNGHGTHVAGTIAADGGSDGNGIYGVAPEAKIFAYKVCGNNGCWADDIAAAIDYAGSNGAEIVSMSLGGDSESSLIRDAILRNPQLLIIAAAGNDGPSIGSIDYPGANANVVAVAAIDSSRNVASWSSRGINDGDYIIEESEVELAAPGVGVESTWNNGGYNTISGTSMATPHVSGLAAKLWQGTASATRVYLQEPAKLIDLDALGDILSTGFGLPTVG